MPAAEIARNQARPAAWQGAARAVAATLLFWAVAAGTLFIAVPGVDTLGRLLVFSECVGLAILGFTVLLSPSRRFPRLKPGLGWLVTGAIAIPAGYVLGHALALLLLGEPFRLAGPGHGRMVPIVLTVLVGGFGLYYLAAREQLAQEAMARSEAQRLATESELRMLRAQLEPHMLFNTLANLRSLVREDAVQAERMIDQLITYLRATLAASRSEASTLGDEFAQLRAYLEIMALRMGPRLSFRLELPDELAPLALPSMLLQPLVENAIKHGIEPKVGPGHLAVVARRTEQGVEISVTDNGLGLTAGGEFQRKLDAPGGSYGLVHVRERLRAVYGAQASLTLLPLLPEGLCSRVRIPP